MNKRAQKILQEQIINMLMSQDKVAFDKSIVKIAALADIMDQSGNEHIANKLDNLIKEAGGWSTFFAGLLGGASPKVWEAIKSGKIREGLSEIVKGALMGVGSAYLVDYLINKLDELPIIGPLLKELGAAEKLKAALESVIAGAVSESDFANKIVDKTLDAIEGFIGIGKTEKQNDNKQNTSFVDSIKNYLTPESVSTPEPLPGVDNSIPKFNQPSATTAIPQT